MELPSHYLIYVHVIIIFQVFQTKIANKIKHRTKPVTEWTSKDVTKWLAEVGFDLKSDDIPRTRSLHGENLLSMPEDQLVLALSLSNRS